MNILEAANISNGVMFQMRVGAYMVKSAIAILNGTPDTADTLLGQRILKGQESVQRWALGVTTVDSVLAGAHDGDGASISDSTVATQVAALWSAFKV
jgi:hypothetical protein